MPFLDLSNEANAGPAIFLHASEIFEAIEIGRDVSSFFMGSLLADGVGFVDVVNASDLKVVRAIVGVG